MDKLLALASEIKKNRSQIKAILKTPPEVHHFVGEKGANGSQGKEGVAGVAGAKGTNGKDGVAGKDGVSIVDVVLDFDNGLSVELSDGTTIDAGSLNLPKDKQSIVSLKQTASGSLKYAETLGDGVASTFTVTHSLNTSDLQVAVYSSEEVVPVVDYVDVMVNTATIAFKSVPASNSIRVVITG